VIRVRARPHKRGYLLIELLAAMILIAVAAAALIPSIINQSQAADRRSLESRLLDLDRRARALSLREGPVVLRHDPDQSEIRMISDAGSVSRTEFGQAELGLVDPEGNAIDRIKIDRFGRSGSYTIRIDIDGSRTELKIHGWTGRAAMIGAGHE
jgi:type II secretory pathway pseudopilin PulG